MELRTRTAQSNTSKLASLMGSKKWSSFSANILSGLSCCLAILRDINGTSIWNGGRDSEVLFSYLIKTEVKR